MALRATKSRDVREATFAERFDSQGSGGAVNDPLPVGLNNATNQSFQITSVAVGNPDLNPEKADTVTFGAIYRPSFALLEGLRQGAWRYLPDTSLGVGLRQAAGMSDLDLGVLALDARVSEPFVGANGFILTPWVGYQFMRIDATSSWVDLTPNRDALAEVRQLRNELPHFIVERELAVFGKEQNRRSCDLFRHRCDVKDRVRRELDVMIEVGHAVGAAVHDASALVDACRASG